MIWEKLLQWLTVAGLSGLKFVPGVALSIGYELSFLEQLLTTTLGGVLGTNVYTFFGQRIRAFFQRTFRRKRSLTEEANRPKSDWHLRLWRKYGLWGTALLTPPILSPPLGVALALSFGTPRRNIIFSFTLSFMFWGVVFALLTLLGLEFLERFR